MFPDVPSSQLASPVRVTFTVHVPDICAVSTFDPAESTHDALPALTNSIDLVPELFPPDATSVTEFVLNGIETPTDLNARIGRAMPLDVFSVLT